MPEAQSCPECGTRLPSSPLMGLCAACLLERGLESEASGLRHCWEIGDRIHDRWEIQRPLRGGLGVVYVVYDHKRGETLVAKTFPDRIPPGDPSVAKRFIREALAWVGLNSHPNVVQVRAIEKVRDRPLLFLEYVAGGELQHWIGARLPGDLALALRFAMQFCDGMTHALTRGVRVHRDIKPQNCLITEDEVLKITDFGLVKVFEDAMRERPARGTMRSGIRGAGSPDLRSQPAGRGADPGLQSPPNAAHERGLTVSGLAFGTPQYMAPEQFDDFHHVNLRADIYSFGVLLFEMVAGEPPFRAESWGELARQHKERQPCLPSSCPDRLREIILTCLAKEPTHRYAYFHQIREQLGEVYQRLTGEAAPPPAEAKAPGAAEFRCRGRLFCEIGESEEAVVSFDRALQIDALDAPTWLEKGSALAELPGRLADALACVERSLELNPGSAAAWAGRSMLLRGAGSHVEAYSASERALALDRFLAKAWVAKGAALGAVGEHDEALACYDQALELEPELQPAWECRASTLTSMGRAEAAIESWEFVLELNPDCSTAWIARGFLLKELGRLVDALLCFKQARELGCSNAEPAIDTCRDAMWTAAAATSGSLDNSTLNRELDRIRQSLQDALHLCEPRLSGLLSVTLRGIAVDLLLLLAAPLPAFAVRQIESMARDLDALRLEPTQRLDYEATRQLDERMAQLESRLMGG